MKRSLIGDGVLLFVTLCWGVTFPLVENAVKEVDPTVFVCARFLLAAIILTPFILFTFKRKNNHGVLQASVILGVLNFIAYVCQTFGMQTASAAQGAFITGICVIIVPFLLPFFKLGKPRRLDIICSIVCLIGLLLLTGGGISVANKGVWWLLSCAFFYALAIVYLQKATQRIQNLNLLAFLQILLVGIFASFFTLGKSYSTVFHQQVLIGILFCATFATSIAFVLQTKYQHYTTASRAVMIFCLEPVFGSLFGYLINNEKLSYLSLLGGTLILLSIVATDIFHRLISRKKILKG